MEYITKYNSPYYFPTNNPLFVMIHHWGVDGQTMAGVVDWFCRKGRGRNGTSAHYVVGGNKVACLVNEGKGAWHAGNRWYNEHSIGIECRPEMDADTYKTVIETVAMVYKHVGKVLPVIGHKDVPGVQTACPGRYYPYLKDIQKQAEALYRSGKAPTGPAASGTTADGKLVVDGEFGSASCRRLQVWLGAPYRDGILSGQLRSQSYYIRNFKWCVAYGRGGSATVKLLQRKVGAGVDGYLGRETITKLQTWLNGNGYKLAVDGIAGPATCKALQQYLNAH